MKKINASELPESLEGFAGGMGYKSITHISATDLGFPVGVDVNGYISQEVDGKYYAEVLNDCGDGEYAESSDITELQKWITDTVYEYALSQADFNKMTSEELKTFVVVNNMTPEFEIKTDDDGTIDFYKVEGGYIETGDVMGDARFTTLSKDELIEYYK